MVTRRFYSNLAPTVMTTGTLSPAATSVTVTSLTGFPGQFPYVAVLERGTATEELVLVTAAVGTSVTISRGYGGTTGKTHQSSVSFEHVVDATDADEANAHVNATGGVHGVAGTIVGASDTQTLTNKTISSSKALATSTDAALVTQVAGSGTQPHLIGKDAAGTVTEYQVSKGGAAQFKNTDVLALTATSITSTGAVTAPVVTVSGAISGSSVSASGAVSGASVAATGAVTGATATFTGTATATAFNATTGTFSGSVTAPNLVTRVAFVQSNAATTGVVTESKDAGIGDVTFTAIAGHSYRFRYVARAESTTAGQATADFRIRDGGGSSPGTGSTLIAACSSGLLESGGPGATQVILDQVVNGLSAGTHKVAAFVDTTAGGAVKAGSSTGQFRQFTIWDEGV